ncbi:hypothetical protein PVK06_044180 [Gossypium arboreum]|uniref:Uncharacterized protein n=1 Tax=Gossypium arboreum TaxID=29729 RepID=A0ABR0MQF5_GOSAR|nr:hypothetical protein PVK06_044180 [Gossypium arboreum]
MYVCLYVCKDSYRAGCRRIVGLDGYLLKGCYGGYLLAALAYAAVENDTEARGKPILTMIETIRTNIMLLIVEKKEEADKWKGMLCSNIRKKLNVNIKDSLRCVPSHAGGDMYQVECGPSKQDVMDLVENSRSYEFPETYVQTWYTKQTLLKIYSNFIRQVKGPKQWAFLSNMLPILPHTLKRPIGRPTKVKRHKVGVHNQVVAPTQQQATLNKQENTPT